MSNDPRFVSMSPEHAAKRAAYAFQVLCALINTVEPKSTDSKYTVRLAASLTDHLLCELQLEHAPLPKSDSL